MNEHASRARSSRGIWLWFTIVVVAVAIGIAFVPQRRVEFITIDTLSAATQPVELIVNGTSMGNTPVRISMDDAFAMSMPEHVPATWSPNNLSVTSANHPRSGHRIHAGTDMSAAAQGAPHLVLFCREGPDPADLQIGAIEIVLRAADGTAWHPETLGATIVSLGPRWTADLKVLFAPPPVPAGP